MYIHLIVSLVVLHEGSRTAIQDALKPWCLGCYADLAYSSYSVASSTHIVHPVITKRSEAELASMHAYHTRRADFWQAGSVASCTMSLALTLMQLAY